MEFTTDVENEVVRESVSQILEESRSTHQKRFGKTQQNPKFQLHISKLVTLSYKQMRATMKCWG